MSPRARRAVRRAAARCARRGIAGAALLVGRGAPPRCIQCGDAVKRLERERRLGRLVHVEELAPDMRHAGRLDNPAIDIELGVAGIAIGLENALESVQMRPRMLPAAVWRLAGERGWRSGAGEWPIVTDEGPEPRRSCPAATRLEHGNHCVVGMHALAAHDVASGQPAVRGRSWAAYFSAAVLVEGTGG